MYTFILLSLFLDLFIFRLHMPFTLFHSLYFLFSSYFELFHFLCTVYHNSFFHLDISYYLSRVYVILCICTLFVQYCIFIFITPFLFQSLFLHISLFVCLFLHVLICLISAAPLLPAIVPALIFPY